MPRAEPRTVPKRTVGASFPTQDETPPFVASRGDDSDEDDLDKIRKNFESIMLSITSPNAGGTDSPKGTPISAQHTPPRSPAAPEPNEDAEKEDGFHTAPGSPTGTGRLSPPLITSQSSPGVRQVPEGQSNVFPPQSVPRYPGE